MNLKIVSFYFFSIILIILFITVFTSLIYWIGKDLKNIFYKVDYIDWRVDEDIYVNYDDANQIFLDHQKIQNYSQSFIVYKNTPLKSKYVNVANIKGISLRASDLFDNNYDVWFFGGSSVFGDGVADKDTIPFIYGEITGKKTANFGVNAFTSRHQLNYFLNALLEFDKPQSVVFFDGFNDVVVNCQSSNYIPTTVKEKEWHKIKNESLSKKNSSFINFFKQPYQSIIYRIKLFNDKFYSARELLGNGCINDDKTLNYIKLDKIIDNYCYNHLAGQKIAKSLNVQFYSILQPNLILSEARDDYINSSHPEGVKYLDELRSLEPLLYYFYKNVINKCNSAKFEIYDFSRTINNFQEDKMYIDAIHLGPSGNRIIASKINNIINSGNNSNLD
tara:strand:- start:1098 stop:2267 length:1170 start_codon:yes stop_codon:yes gene_type:complete